MKKLSAGDVLCIIVVFVIISLAVFTFCSCGTSTTPIARFVNVQCPDSLEIRVDGMTQGYGPEADILIIENLPNVLEIGDWIMVLCPDFTVDSLSLK